MRTMMLSMEMQYQGLGRVLTEISLMYFRWCLHGIGMTQQNS